jgi:hypothetical protein
MTVYSRGENSKKDLPDDFLSATTGTFQADDPSEME